MGPITLENVRASSDITVKLRLKDGGMYIAWTSLADIKAYIFSDAQKAIAGRCDVSIDGDDSTLLICTYSANKPQYPGVNSIVIRANYDGRVKTYDRRAFNIVKRTSSVAGDVVLDDPVVDLELEVADVSSSLLDMAIALAFKAVEEWDQVTVTERGPEGKSAYRVAVDNGFVGTEDEWLESLVGPEGPRGRQGADGEPGPAGVTSAEVTVDNTTGTPSAQISVNAGLLSLSISGIKGETGPQGPQGETGIQGPQGIQGETGPQGATGATGATGAQGPQGERGPAGVTSAVVTVENTTGTPSATATVEDGQLSIALSGIKGEQGIQGNTGSSVDYPYELVNNRTTDDATKGLSAAEGKRLGDDLSQLEAKVDHETEEGQDITLAAYYPSKNIYALGVDADGTTTSNGRTSQPIPVKEGDTVTVYRPIDHNVTLRIFSTDASATSYTLLTSSTSDVVTYSVAADGYIAVSITNQGFDFRVKIQRDYESVKQTETAFTEPTYTASSYVIAVDTGNGSFIPGNLGSSENYKASPYVDVSAYDYIILSVPYIQAVSVAGIAFYDSSQNEIGAVAFSGYTSAFATNDVGLQKFLIPDDVKYLRFTLFTTMSGYTQQYSLSGYSIEKAYGDGLVQKVERLQDEQEELNGQIETLQGDVESLQARGMEGFAESLELGEDVNILAARDNNLFKFGKENGNDFLYLSNDLGVTWTSLQNTYGHLTFAYFWTDGTLMFCTERAAYRTKDLVTISPVTVYDYDGSTTVPSGHRFFNHTTADKPTYIDGVEWCFFYDYILGTTTNSRLWYSNDNGQTIRAAFAFGLSQINGQTVSARHAHGFKYNPFDGYFYAWSGDSAGECHIMRGTYSSGTWTWEVLKTGVEYKLGKIWFDGGNIYAVTDFTDVSMTDEKGFIKCPVSDIDANNYYHLFRATAETMGDASLTNYFADKNGWRVILPDYLGGSSTWVSKDDFNFVELSNSRSVRLNAFFGPDASGNIYCRYATYGASVTESDLFITKMPSINLTEAMRNSGARNFMDYNGYDFINEIGGGLAERSSEKTQWFGKSWMGFGTSITNTANEGKYPVYLSAISGLVFSNHGHSGGGITTSSNESVYDDVMSADLSGADLITLEVGANDEFAPIGTIYDGLPDSEVQDNSTFCGALNILIRHLQANSDAQVVVMCSPTARYQYGHPENKYDGNETYGADNHTIFDRNEAIRKVCQLNSCWYIPAFAMDGMGYARMNASNDYNSDQVHQTNLGGFNFAQAIWAFLKNVPLFYTSIS